MGRYSLRLSGVALRDSKSGLTPVAVSILLILLVTVAASAAGKTKVLYSFCSLPGCSGGSYPEGGVIVDSARNLYGTTNAGGDGFGTIFTLTAESGQWILKTFTARLCMAAVLKPAVMADVARFFSWFP